MILWPPCDSVADGPLSLRPQWDGTITARNPIMIKQCKLLKQVVVPLKLRDNTLRASVWGQLRQHTAFPLHPRTRIVFYE